MVQNEKNSTVFNTELLADTVQKLSLAHDIGEVMKIVRTVARKITGADGATFVLRDGDYCFYAEEDAISPLWKGNRFPLNKCISGWVMMNKSPVVIQDIYQDERIPADVYRLTFVKSLAMVPIRKMEPLGAIGNYWGEHRQPTVAEVAMLQALADITAVSLENIEVRNNLEVKVHERTEELADALAREKETHAMKTMFVSMASHEFRTPLGAILTSASLAEKYVQQEDQEKRQKHIDRIKSSVRHLTSMLDDFLSIGKLEAGNVQIDLVSVNVEDCLYDISTEIDSLKKPGQNIVISFTGHKIVILDKKILRSLILNLLSNALKYSEKDVELNVVIDDTAIVLTIRDHGIGIPQAEQENVFRKFFRAGNTGSIQGTGLGLHIVKHYVELLRGSISFTSEERKGTTFVVRAPIFPVPMQQS